ncbi:DUF1854 domain-containing protein [Candidatus Sumerlaeota bacterium]
MDAKQLRLKRLEDGRFMALREGEEPAEVQLTLCFPWSEPGRHLSVRDNEGEELAFIADMDELEPESRSVARIALGEAGFVLEVETVEEIETEFEIRNWRVRTRQGPCRFQTRIGEFPLETPAGGLLICDVSGNLFHVREPHALDKKSLSLLWSFMG